MPSRDPGKMSVFLSSYYMRMNPTKWSVDSDLPTNSSHRVIRSSNNSLLDAPHRSEDPGPSDLSSSSYNTASPLHFHGLAETQTQTQVASSSEAIGQGSAMPESRVSIPLIINLTSLFPLLTLRQPTITDISSAVSGD